MTDNRFSADWLTLRDSADSRARDEGLVRDLAAHFAGKPDLTILDLGAGSGANLRYLAPRLGTSQHWRLLDNDPDLLARATARIAPGIEAEAYRCDLASDLDKLDFAAADLVTASALMDLVSANWFDSLASRCRDTAAAIFFVLTYDGKMDFEPIDAEDALVRRLVNQHQGRDKGFGPALGPSAAAFMENRLQDLGYRLRSARSDWQLGPGDEALQEALLAGYAAAAIEMAPDAATRLQAWLSRRRGHLTAGTGQLRVGHLDLLALP